MAGAPQHTLAIRVLEEAARRRQRRQLLLEVVIRAFVLDPTAKVKRSLVYAHVARCLRRAVSNELCNVVRAALADLPEVLEVVSNGRARFRGLRS